VLHLDPQTLHTLNMAAEAGIYISHGSTTANLIQRTKLGPANASVGGQVESAVK